MKSNQLRFAGYCLLIGSMAALTLMMPACSCSTKSSSTSTSISASIATTTPTSTPKSKLSSIVVEPTLHSVAVGSTQAFTATGTYSDGTSVDITAGVTWASKDTGVATIDSTGLATGVATGTATITAALSGVTSAPVLLAVIAPPTVPTSTPISNVTTSPTTSASTSTTTSPSPFAFQGSGTGVWSGTVLYNNKERDVGGCP